MSLFFIKDTNILSTITVYKLIWSVGSNSYTSYTKPYFIKMQSDGNLVLFVANNKIVWASYTQNVGNVGRRLVLWNDGSLTILDGFNLVIWNAPTGTYIFIDLFNNNIFLWGFILVTAFIEIYPISSIF